MSEKKQFPTSQRTFPNDKSPRSPEDDDLVFGRFRRVDRYNTAQPYWATVHFRGYAGDKVRIELPLSPKSLSSTKGPRGDVTGLGTYMGLRYRV